MNDLKLTLPPMGADQTHWNIFITPPPMFTSEPQAWWRRWIYSSLMWLSYRAPSGTGRTARRNRFQKGSSMSDFRKLGNTSPY